MIIPHPDLPCLDAKKSIFINCPYDNDYKEFFDALIFTIIACGFIPRSAKESEMWPVPRMERIVHAIYTSDYSIHDLSRCHGEGETMLARFNMPLELGLAMSRQYAGNGASIHNWKVLIPTDEPYAQFVSDLVGFDHLPYRKNTRALIGSVLAWLLNLPDAIPWRSPQPIVEGLQIFSEEKNRMEVEWSRDLPWKSLLDLAQDHVPEFT